MIYLRSFHVEQEVEKCQRQRETSWADTHTHTHTPSSSSPALTGHCPGNYHLHFVSISWSQADDRSHICCSGGQGPSPGSESWVRVQCPSPCPGSESWVRVQGPAGSGCCRKDKDAVCVHYNSNVQNSFHVFFSHSFSPKHRVEQSDGMCQ